jgi:hypothetical protein
MNNSGYSHTVAVGMFNKTLFELPATKKPFQESSQLPEDEEGDSSRNVGFSTV